MGHAVPGRALSALSARNMKAASEAAARVQAAIGGAGVHEVTHVSEPKLVGVGLWLITVRVLMTDGSVRAFECDATERDVFAIRHMTGT
jgi:hypothetical protein